MSVFTLSTGITYQFEMSPASQTGVTDNMDGTYDIDAGDVGFTGFSLHIFKGAGNWLAYMDYAILVSNFNTDAGDVRLDTFAGWVDNGEEDFTFTLSPAYLATQTGLTPSLFQDSLQAILMGMPTLPTNVTFNPVPLFRALDTVNETPAGYYWQVPLADEIVITVTPAQYWELSPDPRQDHGNANIGSFRLGGDLWEDVNSPATSPPISMNSTDWSDWYGQWADDEATSGKMTLTIDKNTLQMLIPPTNVNASGYPGFMVIHNAQRVYHRYHATQTNATVTYVAQASAIDSGSGNFDAYLRGSLALKFTPATNYTIDMTNTTVDGTALTQYIIDTGSTWNDNLDGTHTLTIPSAWVDLSGIFPGYQSEIVAVGLQSSTPQAGAVTATFTGTTYRRLPNGSWITPLPPHYGGKTMSTSHDFMSPNAAGIHDDQLYQGQGLRPAKRES